MNPYKRRTHYPESQLRRRKPELFEFVFWLMIGALILFMLFEAFWNRRTRSPEQQPLTAIEEVAR